MGNHLCPPQHVVHEDQPVQHTSHGGDALAHPAVRRHRGRRGSRNRDHHSRRRHSRSRSRSRSRSNSSGRSRDRRRHRPRRRHSSSGSESDSDSDSSSGSHDSSICEPAPTLHEQDTSASATEVVELDSKAQDPLYTNVFALYTKHIAPNGLPISIVAQRGVSVAKVAHALRILRLHLQSKPAQTMHPSTCLRYGVDKANVANSMADQRAILMIFRNERGFKEFRKSPLGSRELSGQDLHADEIVCDGVCAARDASYEEIFHLVQEYGIRYALPDMHQAIMEHCRRAMASRLYRPLPDMLEDPDTPSFEYFVICMEVYYGIWRGSPYAGGNEYSHTTVEAMRQHDPVMFELVDSFCLSSNHVEMSSCLKASGYAPVALR